MPLSSPRPLQCMEVWGGNVATADAVTMPGLDAWVYSRPHNNDDSGGDIYYLSSCATGRITRLLVADVSGHGAPAAEVARQLRDLMRRHINHLDQSRLVEGINREFTDAADHGRFATAFVATFWAPTCRIVAANAGHPPPLHYDAASRSWRYLELKQTSRAAGRSDNTPANLPFGIANADYDQFAVRLREGDLVLLYTDSLVEARCPKGPDGRPGPMLGAKGLWALADATDASDPAAFLPGLIAKIEAHCGGPETGDDLTAILLRPNGTRPKPSVAAAFAAAGRIAKSVALSALGKGPAGLPELSVANIGGAAVESLNERV